MPPGSKKRKALKKKQQEKDATGAATDNKAFNGHGNDEHGSQDERGGDGNLSSPGSQGDGEYGTRDPSPPPLSDLGKDTVKEKAEDADFTRGQEAKSGDGIAVGRGTDHDKTHNSFPEKLTHVTSKVTSEEAGGTSTLEIAPALDTVKPVGSSVSMVVIPDKNEQGQSSTGLDSVPHKSDENEEKRRVKEAEEGNVPQSAAETSKEIKNVKEHEVPECSNEKSLLPTGPPVVRTSWLSCCGLFDVMAGSER